MMIVVEHFPKWIEIVAFLNKYNERDAYAFLDCILSRFGAFIKVLMDYRKELLGELQALCEQALIDQWTTSQDDLEANQLVKNVVQILKHGLCNFGLQKGLLGDWDHQFPWLTMGYWFNKENSIMSFSLCFLLFGHELDLHASIQQNVTTT